MQKQKSVVIVLVSIVSLCVLGVVSSLFFNWPVDSQRVSGNVAKSTRFSRKTAEDGATLMQELLLNDAQYKNNVVAAYLVMQARAKQFNALVDMSSQVAGGIKAFEPVLSDMKKAQPMVENVCSSMAAAASDLNSALGGKNPKNLAQSTNNAALAYNTLQKQNSLATRFIETTDEYLKGNSAEDKLKFVRDQWVEYQQATAALEQDSEAAAALAAKGRLLDAEQAVSALRMFNQNDQEAVLFGVALEANMGMEPSLGPVLSLAGAEEFMGMAGGADVVIMNNTGEEVFHLSEDETVLKRADGETVVMNSQGETVMQMTDAQVVVKNGAGETYMQLSPDEVVMKNADGEVFLKNGHDEIVMQLSGTNNPIGMAGGADIVIMNNTGEQVFKLAEGDTVCKNLDGDTVVKNGTGEEVLKMSGVEVVLQNGSGETSIKLSGDESIIKNSDSAVYMKNGEGETFMKLCGSNNPLSQHMMANTSSDLTNLQQAAGDVTTMNLGAGADTFLSNAGGVSTVINNLAGGEVTLVGMNSQENPR